MKRFEDLRIQIPFLAEFRRIFAKFRIIGSHIPVFSQRFIGILAHQHIGTSAHSQSQEPRAKSQDSTKYPVLSTKNIADSPILSTQYSVFNPIFKLTHSLISKFSIIFILLTLASSLKAQLLVPLSNEMNRRFEYEMIQSRTPVFTVMKPYIQNQDSTQYSVLSTEKWFHRKLFHESLIQVDSGSFYLFADPVFEFGVGRDSKGRNTMINTRGLRIGGQLGKYFAFGTDFYENQAIFNSALDTEFRKDKVIPGQGRGRINGNTWDYAHASGYLSFSPIRQLNIRVGQGKHFIGDGYRSLILSDAAYTNPYASATWQSKKWMYSWMISSVQNFGLKIQLASNKEPFKHETLSTHLLSLQLSNGIQLSLVQSQMFNIPDTFGRTKADIRLFNPLLLPVPDNSNIHSLWGMNLKINLNHYIILYGQLVIDNLMNSSKKKMGLQLGLKYYDVAGVRGLYAQTEYNRIDPNTYTSSSKALQWMHFGEPLAHPLGSNIEEIMLSLSYTWHRWQINNQTNFIHNKEGLDNYSNITNPPLPQFVTSQQLLWNRSELAFYINTKTLMNVAVGYIYRKETLAGNANALSQFYFTFRTSLLNTYYDR